MTLYVDTSALVRRYLRDRHRDVVVEAMAATTRGARRRWRAPRRSWRCTGRRCRRGSRRALWRELRDEWDAFWVVPMDDRCMARAVEIGATYGVRIVDAIHLAAADRLPGPVRYLTFERQQIPAADALGFEVISAVRLRSSRNVFQS